MPTLIIAGIDSDLARPVIDFGLEQGLRIVGTTRNSSLTLTRPGIDAVYFCDFSSENSINICVDEIVKAEKDSKLICIFSIGTLEPIGKFGEVDFNNWLNGIQINGLGPLCFIHNLLSKRKSERDFFLTYSGNGTNSSPTHFSSYTLAKIMLIKSMEILAAEYPYKTFISLGTGWMKSKIHFPTLNSDSVPSEILDETKRRLEFDNFGNPDLIKEFISVVINFNPEIASGRNFSLQNDPWQEKVFWEKLVKSEDFHKLRRRSFSA